MDLSHSKPRDCLAAFKMSLETIYVVRHGVRPLVLRVKNTPLPEILKPIYRWLETSEGERVQRKNKLKMLNVLLVPV